MSVAIDGDIRTAINKETFDQECTTDAGELSTDNPSSDAYCFLVSAVIV